MKKFILACLYLLFLQSQIAIAGQFTWTGNAGNSFSDPDNWDGSAGIPGSNDTIIIDNLANHPILDSDITVYYIQMLASSLLDLDTFNLTVEGFADMQGGKVLNGEMIIRGESAVFNGTEFSCKLNVYANYIDLLYGTFNNTCYFELMGSATCSSFGSCTFLDSVSIVNTGSGDWHLGSNQFDRDVILMVTSIGPLYMSQTGETYFNGNLYLNNTGTAPIVFGYDGGASYLADGKVLAIGDSGYAENDLFITMLNQAGGQEQYLELTGNANIFLQSCLFNGDVNFSASGILCSGSLFNGDAVMDKTGSENNYWAGNNYFYGITSITNSSSGGDNVLCLSSSDGNTFYNDASFYSTHGKLLEVDYSGQTDFYGDLFINSASIGFNNSVCFKGDQNQTIKGNTPVSFDNLIIQKSSNSVTADTIVQINDTMIFNNGNLITTNQHLVVIKASAAVSGASDSSFVNGPVTKFGNTSFAFPVGKGNQYGPIVISSPDSSTDSFQAEYYNVSQTLGDSVAFGIFSFNPSNYWRLDVINGSSDVSLTLNWDKFLYGYGVDSSNLKIAYWNSTLWSVVPTSTISKTANVISLPSSSSISNYGYFTVVNAGITSQYSTILTAEKKIQIWGAYSRGQHGSCIYNMHNPSYTDINILSYDDATYCPNNFSFQYPLQIGSRYPHQLAISCNNLAYEWGDNQYNQIANPAIHITSFFQSNTAVPIIFSGPTPEILSVATTQYGAAAVDAEGQVWYWGTNTAGPNPPIPNTGTNVPFLLSFSGTIIDNAIQVSGGDKHILILLQDGSVLAYGNNATAQLGIGNTNIINGVVKVKTGTSTYLSNIKYISAGGNFSLALNINGTMYGWGQNVNGQVGIGTQTSEEAYAVPCTSVTNIDAIAAGSTHALALKSGDVYGWGYNGSYQTGVGSAGPYLYPQIVTLPVGAQDIININAGELHSLAFSEDLKIYAWGDNEYFQLAIPYNTLPGKTLPIEISGNNNGAVNIDDFNVPCDNFENYCYLSYIFDANTGAVTWDNTSHPTCNLTNGVIIKDELFISKGTHLTLENIAIYFGPNGRIVLEEGDGSNAGGILELGNGARLTAISKCMWKGIEVRGNSSYPSSNSRQAKVIVNSGAIIEHAHNATTLGKWDENYYACAESNPSSTNPSGFDLSGSGGQIECDDATFQYNAIDIRFAPYRNLSASTIENSHFLGGVLRDPRYLFGIGSVNNQFYADPNATQRASVGIKQWQSKIVPVQGNNFEDYEEAIQLTDSRLRIIGNDFKNSRNGISTISTLSVLIYGGQVEGNTFKNVRTHINAAGGRYLSITEGNNFNDPFFPGSQQVNLCGISLNSERAFAIYDNNFTNLRFGILINSSGFSGGVIRYESGPFGNLFTDCWRSIQMGGNNQNLKIKCNQFNNATGGSSYSTNWNLAQGLNSNLSDQGFPSLLEQTSQAGNWFANTPIRKEVTNSSITPFTYFRHSSPDEIIPIPNGSGTITIDANSTDMLDFDDACAPVVVPSNGEPDRIAYFENIIDSLNLEMDTLSDNIDNQLTDSLLSVINDSYSQDTILNILQANGPLSDTVLIKAINTSDALNDTALYEILFVNSPYSPEVLQALNERDPEMDVSLRDSLDLAQGINPPYITKTSLNKELNYYKLDKRLLINAYVTRLTNEDSVYKAIVVLEDAGTYEDQQTIFGTYVALGELDSASVKLETIQNSDQAETDWLDLSEILLSLAYEGKTWFDITSGQEETIREMANQEENTLAKIQSQNVLHLVYGDTFPVIIDNEEVYLRQMFSQTNNHDKVVINELTLIPNPANEKVEIRMIGTNEKPLFINLLDMEGKEVMNSTVQPQNNIQILDIRKLNTGLFIVKITGNEGGIYTNKLLIVR